MVDSKVAGLVLLAGLGSCIAGVASNGSGALIVLGIVLFGASAVINYLSKKARGIED